MFSPSLRLLRLLLLRCCAAAVVLGGVVTGAVIASVQTDTCHCDAAALPPTSGSAVGPRAKVATHAAMPSPPLTTVQSACAANAQLVLARAGARRLCIVCLL